MSWVTGLAALLAGVAAGFGLNWLARRLPGAAALRVGPRMLRWRERALPGVTGLVTLALWLRHGPQLALLPAAIAAWFLLLVAAIDIDRRLVLNRMMLAGALLALLYALLGGWRTLAPALGGAVIGFGLFLLFALLSRGALGAGDVKLAGVLGLLLGFPVALRALLLAVMLGGLTAGVLLVTRRVDRKAFIPYAPFLAAGAILTLMW